MTKWEDRSGAEFEDRTGADFEGETDALQAHGYNAAIGYQQETIYGADPAVPALTKLYYVTEGVKLDREIRRSNIMSQGRNPVAPKLGRHNAPGTIVTNLQAYMGTIYKAILGSAATVAPAHTITVGASLPSLLYEKGFTDLAVPKYFKYNGLKVNKATIKVRPEGEQEVSLDTIGSKETVGDASFDAVMTDLGYQPFEGFNIAAITEGGEMIATVTEADITIENNLDGNVYCINPINPGVRRSLPLGQIRVSGMLKTLFEDLALYTKAINSTESRFEVVYTLGTGAGTAGNEQLIITVPELIYQPNTPVISGPAGLFVELPFEAYYTNSDEASCIQMVLKNTQLTI